jgi:hypothetical protein
MSQNFINARRLRRAVVAEFEQQQKADAEAAKRIRDCILVNTKDLLESLSTMLEGYCEQSGISGAERDLFSTISPSVSLDGGLACRKSHAGSERRAVSLREELRQAQKNYNDAAPLGPLSRPFKSENEKHVIDAFKSKCDKLSSELSAVDTEIVHFEHCIQEKARSFFKEAMGKKSLEYLRSNESSVSDQTRKALAKLQDDVRELVDRHLTVQARSLAMVQRDVTTLAGSYEMWTGGVGVK